MIDSSMTKEIEIFREICKINKAVMWKNHESIDFYSMKVLGYVPLNRYRPINLYCDIIRIISFFLFAWLM